MCGVAGFWNKDHRLANADILESMLARLSHRGPDDQGVWTHGPVGLGQNRLSILDLSDRGHQPFVTLDGKGVLSYNGEIYNYRDLRKKLASEGITFRSQTDTEVVLYALHEWGPEKAIPFFNGMFAFAYYDFRTETLWLARDRMGIRPLYFSETENSLVFASEMKALFEHPDIPCRPDKQALTTHLLLGRLDGTWTPFENVHCLLPGTYMKVGSDGRAIVTYFDLLRDIEPERILQAATEPFESQCHYFEFLFQESVQAHLVSDVPLATMCSGGLDSSLMTAVAKLYKPDLVAYVADIQEVRVSEGENAQKVCDHLGLGLRRIEVSPESFIYLWSRAVYHNDQPLFFPQNVAAMAIAEAAHHDGFKVILSGEGSDELFGGYSWQVEMYKMWRARRIQSRLIPNVKWMHRLFNLLNCLRPLDIPRLRQHPFDHLSEPGISQNPKFLAAVDGAQRSFRASALFSKLRLIRPVEERAFLARAFEDCYSHLRTSLSSVEKMGMSHAIESRVPFLENRLIDFVLHLPCSAKFHRGVTKRIVKKIAEKYLPREIVHARKIGFGMPAAMWKSSAPLLRGGMAAELFHWGSNEALKIYEHITADDQLLFHLLSLEIWARIYLRHDSFEAVTGELLKHRPAASLKARMPSVSREASAVAKKLVGELT